MHRAPSAPRSPDSRDQAACGIELTREAGSAAPGGCVVVRSPAAEAPVSPVGEPQDVSSWDLVFAAQRGDLAAFATIYRRHYSAVFAYVHRKVFDYGQAEDITSETFLRAFRRMHTVRDQGKDLRAWFTAIARNIVIDLTRSAPYRRELGVAEATVCAQESVQPDEEIVLSQVRHELLRCVQKLGDAQRQCVLLRFYECFSVGETARIMGRNEAAVRALQHRAIRKLSTIVPQWLERVG